MQALSFAAWRFDSMQHWCRGLMQRLARRAVRQGWKGLVGLVMILGLGGAAIAATQMEAPWSCDGEPLSVRLMSGAVDLRGLPPNVPNTEGNTAPGDGVLIKWRGQTLQLPRTNNAGAPSYTDGRWWWRVLNPEQAEWKERRGQIFSYTCQAMEMEP